MTTLFAGGEDHDFGVLNTVMNGSTFGFGTTASSFRTGIARGSLSHFNGTSNNVDNTRYITASFAATTQFWTTFRMNYQTFGTTVSNATLRPVKFFDASGIERLRIQYKNAFNSPNDTFDVFKVDAAGTATQIGSTSTGRFGGGVAQNNILSAANLDKIDVFINYAVAGQFTVYLNGTQTFTFSGDVTTNSVTTLGMLGLGQNCIASNNGCAAYYSEVYVDTADTRNITMVSRVATAFGNTHNFDGGTVANIAATLMSTGDASPNFSGTAGQIQQFQVTPALPAGNYSVVGVVHKIRALAGQTGPSKYDDMIRVGGTDYASADIAPGANWSTSQTVWATNPNTGVAWLTGDIVNASTAYNIGVKSVT